ncbi:hypothetical protein KSP39_PZI006734 [Platanthera zijinensis]|uniref:Uncharacterized protein n=1 Tax=Platanthera zijinensis TaxID=2320716 RepID=A0AAP0BRP5_9ASPA
MPAKNFRKRSLEQDDAGAESEDEDDRRMALEEVKFIQKQRERKVGIPALPIVQSSTTGALVRSVEKAEGDGEKEDLVLQDTFAQETAVIVEDPNMLKYVEQEIAKKRGKKIDYGEKTDKDPMDELYAIPEHLKVKKRNSEESSTQWTTGIAEIQLPIELASSMKLAVQEVYLLIKRASPGSTFSLPMKDNSDPTLLFSQTGTTLLPGSAEPQFRACGSRLRYC